MSLKAAANVFAWMAVNPFLLSWLYIYRLDHGIGNPVESVMGWGLSCAYCAWRAATIAHEGKKQ